VIDICGPLTSSVRITEADTPHPWFRRYAAAKVATALEDTRVVLVIGPRQADAARH
jgi:hypothetical protein